MTKQTDGGPVFTAEQRAQRIINMAEQHDSGLCSCVTLLECDSVYLGEVVKELRGYATDMLRARAAQPPAAPLSPAEKQAEHIATFGGGK